MRTRIVVWIAVGILLAANVLSAQQRKVTKLAEGVYSIEHAAGGDMAAHLVKVAFEEASLR